MRDVSPSIHLYAQPVHKGSRHKACLNIWSHTHKHVGLFLVPCCTLSLGCLILLSMTKYVNFNFLQQTLMQIFQHLKMHSIFMTLRSIENRFNSIHVMVLLCQPLVKLYGCSWPWAVECKNTSLRKILAVCWMIFLGRKSSMYLGQ